MTNATTARTNLEHVRDHLVDALLDVNAVGGSDTAELRESARDSILTALTLLGGVTG